MGRAHRPDAAALLTVARGARFGTLAAGCLACAAAGAASWLYLARDERLCTQDQLACVRGTLTFERNYRVLRLRGRVEQAPGPGLFTVWVSGEGRGGARRYAPMEIEIRGRRSEIVNPGPRSGTRNPESWR